MTPAPCLLTEDDARPLMDAEIVAAMQGIPPATIGGAGGGWVDERGRFYDSQWNTYSSGTTGTYTYPTTGSCSGTYTLSYGGGGGTTCIGYGGSGGWVYPGATDTSFPPYEGPVTPPETDEEREASRATRRWLQAEQDWKDAERQRQRAAAKAKAKALLLSLLPEPEKERYPLQGFFEVLGSHGGRYRIKRTSAGAFR
ncbi:MAG: hypothetical protein WA630_27135 [Mycobacterium sp.]